MNNDGTAADIPGVLTTDPTERHNTGIARRNCRDRNALIEYYSKADQRITARQLSARTLPSIKSPQKLPKVTQSKRCTFCT